MISTCAEHPDAVATPKCRRSATRYEPTRREARLTWREAPAVGDRSGEEPGGRADRGRHQQFALLLDISHTGASMVLDRVPRDEIEVRLHLEGETQADWTVAQVVGVTTTLRGPHLVRLAFPVLCAFETLELAILG